MHLFICFFVTDFVRKIGAHPGLAKEPLIPFNVQKMDFLLIGFLSSINDDFKRGCVTGDFLQAWLLPNLNTIPNNFVGEVSLAPWLWYLLFFVQASLVQILSESYISAMHLFICFFVTDFVRKNLHRPFVTHCKYILS